MQRNKLSIQINKSPHDVFLFSITPPNTIYWVPGVVAEETSEWPIQVGTIDQMQDANGTVTSVKVVTIEQDKMIEWQSMDGNYHCRYNLEPIDGGVSRFNYLEWVDKGEIENPFTQEVLEKLKLEIEKIK